MRHYDGGVVYINSDQKQKKYLGLTLFRVEIFWKTPAGTADSEVLDFLISTRRWVQHTTLYELCSNYERIYYIY